MSNILIQYGILIIGFLSSLAYYYFKGRSDSKRDIELNQSKKRLEDLKTSKKVETEVEKIPNSGLDSKLSRWMRND